MSRFKYIPRATLSLHTGPLYQSKEVARDRAMLSVQCMDNEVCMDKFGTDSESVSYDSYPDCIENET